MKILIAVRWPTGGIRTYIRYVYRQPEFQVHDYCLVTPYTAHSSYLKDIFPNGRLRHIEIDQKLSALFWGVSRAVIQFKPDLIHSHGIISAFLTAPAAKLAGIPHLLTSHDVLLPEQFNGLNGAMRLWGLGALFRLCTHVMTVGEDAKGNLETYFPDLFRRNRVTAIRNGIDTEAFLTDNMRDLHQELGIDSEAALFGFFGRFMGQKGFSLLVKAAAGLREEGWPINVACFGWGGFIREEQAELRAAGLGNIFHFLPHTDDMVAALRGVDAMVMPSRWEACPLLPMEAMVAGTPVIASNCIGLREVVQDTPALVFESGSSDDLKECMREFLSTPIEYRKYATAFRQKAAEKFDARKSALKLNDLYSSLVP